MSAHVALTTPYNAINNFVSAHAMKSLTLVSHDGGGGLRRAACGGGVTFLEMPCGEYNKHMRKISSDYQNPRGPAPGTVYIARIGKFIKIGFSRCVGSRMSTFMTSSPDVELLIAIAGERDLEKRLHKLFSEVKVAREIFHPDWRITSFIRWVKQDGLQSALQFLEESTPKRREEKKEQARLERVRVGQISRAEKDAYFASLVAERKKRLGW